jgi:MFS family permease
MTRFRRLAITHAAMTGGDAAMLVALADSLFLSIDPSAARGRVLLFLVVSFAPFVVLGPLIGPAIDRAAGGRRFVIQLVALGRVVITLGMALAIDSLALFPLVFAALVLQKAYLVSKSAIVPSVVRSEADLVEANSKLGVIAGLTGFVAVLPAAALQLVDPLAGWATLIYAAAMFTIGLLSARRLPADVIAATAEAPAERTQLHAPRIRSGALAMTLLRASVGFLLFHLAFWLRSVSAGTFWFALAVAASALGSMLGNVLAPRLRARTSEEHMLTLALSLGVVAGGVAAVLGGPPAGVLLAGALNMAAAIGRMGFESIVQHDAPQANRGRAFAQFETRFQLAWALAGVVPVVIVIPGPIGFLVCGVLCAVALGPVLRFLSERVAPRFRTRGGRARGRERRARSEWGPPRPG